MAQEYMAQEYSKTIQLGSACGYPRMHIYVKDNTVTNTTIPERFVPLGKRHQAVAAHIDSPEPLLKLGRALVHLGLC